VEAEEAVVQLQLQLAAVLVAAARGQRSLMSLFICSTVVSINRSSNPCDCVRRENEPVQAVEEVCS